MDRIATAFARARDAEGALLVSYVCAGDPDYETSVRICEELIAAGVGVLELGVPFSDPLADGLTNQLAAERALASGMTPSRVFDLVRRLRESSAVPIILYTYYNLVMAPGVDAYCREAAAAGVDGLLTLDLPPEEAEELREACARHALKTVFIVAPTTPEARLPVIAGAANGFLYYVSQEGVTGVRDELASGIDTALARIRAHTRLPIVVGFGIGNAAQVRAVAADADGVVVGSALVNCIPAHAGDPDAIVAALGAKARELVSGLK
jgi:tryptophan synthase alpha chain